MPKIKRTIADGMLIQNTPIEDYRNDFGFFVKREDLCCPKPGPPFSKTRGVFARVRDVPEKVIGVLDTAHSQAGHAVARACQILGKKCHNYYPVYKKEADLIKPQQKAAKELGATLHGLPAGRSCILFHQAKKLTEAKGGYMMPNALKLEESVTETAKEVPDDRYDLVIVPASSGTIAAGVMAGFLQRKIYPEFIIHLGYSRSHTEVRDYLRKMSGDTKPSLLVNIIDEGYAYKDMAEEGPDPLWPCNAYYDLKAFRWWMKNRSAYRNRKTLFWNIG